MRTSPTPHTPFRIGARRDAKYGTILLRGMKYNRAMLKTCPLQDHLKTTFKIEKKLIYHFVLTSLIGHFTPFRLKGFSEQRVVLVCWEGQKEQIIVESDCRLHLMLSINVSSLVKNPRPQLDYCILIRLSEAIAIAIVYFIQTKVVAYNRNY